MPSRRASVEQRRAALVARSQAHRAELVRELEALGPSFRLVDRFVDAAGWVRRHGLVIVGVAALVIAVRKPSRLIGYASRAWSLWQIYRGYRERFDGLLARFERRV